MELQLCGDLFLSLGCSDCREDKIDVLFGTGFVCNNAIVIEVSNDRKILYTLPCVDVLNGRHPFLIGTFCVKISIEKIGVSMQIFSIIAVFLTANYGKQIVFLHNTYHLFLLIFFLLSKGV